MSTRSFLHVLSLALVGTLAMAAQLKALDFDGMSKDERKPFLAAYLEIDAIDQILPICDEIAPNYSAANQAAMAEFMEARSIGRARSLIDQYIVWQEAENEALKLILGLTRRRLASAMMTTCIIWKRRCLIAMARSST